MGGRTTEERQGEIEREKERERSTTTSTPSPTNRVTKQYNSVIHWSFFFHNLILIEFVLDFINNEKEDTIEKIDLRKEQSTPGDPMLVLVLVGLRVAALMQIS